MLIFRQIFGVIYLLAILIIAVNILYYLFWGIFPVNLRNVLESSMNTVDYVANILCLPINLILSEIVKLTPEFVKINYPVTVTGVLGAKIAWNPIISLFIYTNIVKSFDDYVVQKRLKAQYLANKNDTSTLFIENNSEYTNPAPIEQDFKEEEQE